jgi:CRP-like cAMP-binding protein
MSDEVSKKIDQFFSGYGKKKYQKGQILIFAGDNPGCIYHLIRGKVKQYDVTKRGDEIILNVFKPPAFFPMSLAINSVPNPYIFEAETDTELHQVPAEEAVTFLRDNPDVMFDLLSRLYRGMDGVLGRMVQLMSTSAASRLMYELTVEARRFGKIQKDGSVALKINEKELGARAGITRETVSRQMHKLKAENQVLLENGRIIIRDLAKMERHLY